MRWSQTAIKCKRYLMAHVLRWKPNTKPRGANMFKLQVSQIQVNWIYIWIILAVYSWWWGWWCLRWSNRHQYRRCPWIERNAALKEGSDGHDQTISEKSLSTFIRKWKRRQSCWFQSWSHWNGQIYCRKIRWILILQW